MQNDDVIWHIINHQFCSFKSKVAKEHTFCSNPYSVSGLCIRSACPLANSSYATIREENGVCYLFMKTIERAHTPKNLWEKIKLPGNYVKSLEIVSKHLEHMPKYLVHRNKQRLTKIHQMLIRMRKLKLKAKPKIVTTNAKVDKREVGKERKALKAANLDRAIENELLERLRQVTEGEIYNYPEKAYSKVLNKAANKYKATEDGGEEEEDPDEEYEGEEQELNEAQREVGEEEEDEEDENEDYNVEYIEDFEESDTEDADLEDTDQLLELQQSTNGKRSASSSSDSNGSSDSSSSSKKKKVNSSTGSSSSNSKPRVEIEYEYEDEDEEIARNTAMNASSSGRGVAASTMDYNF